MEYFNNLDWSAVWHILKDIVLPHTGTLIFNIVLFLFIGLFLSITFLIILQKKKVFKRIPRYYNWIVKLYIPLLIAGFLYFFGHIGFIRGVYKILDKESETIVAGVYNNILELSFDSEESKNELVTKLQESAIEFRDGSDSMTISLKAIATEHNTGHSLVDGGKDKVATFVIDTYGDNVYKLTLYGMLNVAGPHINLNESLSYEEFSTAMDFLLEVGHKDIEQAIKDKLTIGLESLFYSQYKSFVWSYVILILIMMGIPLIEFLIYKKWVEPKYLIN